MQGSSDPNPELLDAAALCRHLVDPKSVAALLADHRRELFPDELFQDLFPSGRGRPSVPADVIASVLVLQALEGLSDRDAAAQLRTNIAWKVACGLSLDDPGFHATVLTLWRNRLRTSERPQRIFDAVRQLVADTGVIATRQRRALDSTVLDDAVTRQDTLMQLTAQIRVVRRLIPEARALQLCAHDYENGGAKPACAWNDPTDIDRVVTELVSDAQTVLATVQGMDLSEQQMEAVGLLALVSGQDVEPGDRDGTWRIAQRTAPDRIVSVHDPESRHVHKTVEGYRDGFKAHIAVEPETGLVTACELTAGNVSDGQAAVQLLAGEASGLEVFADTAYGSGDHRAALRDARHVAVIKPFPLRPAVPGGFTVDDFTVNLAAGTATCPAGQTVPISPARTANYLGRCQPCSLRSRCTSASGGRKLTIHEHFDLLAAARAQAESDEFQCTYRQWRPLVERSLAWLVRKGHRRVAYRGVERNRLWLGHRAAAVNLRRLLNLGLQRTTDGWAIA